MCRGWFEQIIFLSVLAHFYEENNLISSCQERKFIVLRTSRSYRYLYLAMTVHAALNRLVLQLVREPKF